MASHSLYRKWRSQSFDEIIGQEPIVRTLRNAVKTGRVAHAYLFTGPRGTGKTSMARILAKAVNCTNPMEGAPCGTCALCLSIASGRNADVVEIDGASNNSIDDVRSLRERVAFAPTEGRHRVYIIDEVHRLSGSAFDGLLKTLEEPPSHVLFVFASTEPHKVPATILSRCQRFDFRRIPRPETIERLREVAVDESISISDDALALMAQQSGGSLRDALGLLDQVSAFAGARVELEDVHQSLGLVRPTTVVELTDHILHSEVGEALTVANASIAAGADPRQLMQQLVDYWRGLLLHVGGAAAAADVDPALVEPLAAHAKQLRPAQVVAVLRVLTEPAVGPRVNVAPQLTLEMALVQAALTFEPEGPARGKGPPVAVNGLATSERATGPEKRSPGIVAPTDAEAGKVAEPNDGASEPDEPGAAPEGKGLGADATPRTTEGRPSVIDDVNVQEMWPAVLDSMRSRNRRLQALLHDAFPLRVADGAVTLGFSYTFHRDQIDQPENRSMVELAMTEVLGAPIRVRCELASRDSIQALRNAEDDDGFITEAERLLRAVHARRLNDGDHKDY